MLPRTTPIPLISHAERRAAAGFVIVLLSAAPVEPVLSLGCGGGLWCFTPPTIYLESGRVRLIPRHDLDKDWSPAQDERLTVWEITNHLACCLETRGEQAAARLLAQVGGLADSARHLAYRLHHICDRNGWAADALAYNSLAAAWPDLTQQAHKLPTEDQANLALDT